MTARDTERELCYDWLTSMRPYDLLKTCTPYSTHGGFRAQVEAVIYPSTASRQFNVLASKDYLVGGSQLESAAGAVRFNADTTDAFSIVWAPEVSGHGAQGRVYAITGGNGESMSIMQEMIKESAVARLRTEDIEAMLSRGKPFSDQPAPASPDDTSRAQESVLSVSIPRGRLYGVSRLSAQVLKPGESLWHEVALASTVPGAQGEAEGLVCEVSVSPKGWVNLSDLSHLVDVKATEVPGRPSWHAPREGRRGLGSRYVYEAEVVRSEVGATTNPPTLRRPPHGKHRAEVRTVFNRGGVEICRLDHTFWIDIPGSVANPGPMSPAFAEELNYLLSLAPLTEEDIALATGTDVPTVRAWLSGARVPTGAAADRVTELSSTIERLTQVVSPEFVALWVRKPLVALDDEKPLDVLARGEYRRISRVIAALESPVAS